jgi:hypothetical protein
VLRALTLRSENHPPARYRLQSCGKVTVRVRPESDVSIDLISGVDETIDEDNELVRAFGDRAVDPAYVGLVRYRITENIDNTGVFKGTVEILCDGLEVADCETCSRLSSSGEQSANTNGCFKYTPAPNFHGEVRFKYTAAIDDPSVEFFSAPFPMGVKITVRLEFPQS